MPEGRTKDRTGDGHYWKSMTTIGHAQANVHLMRKREKEQLYKSQGNGGTKNGDMTNWMQFWKISMKITAYGGVAINCWLNAIDG